MSAFGLAGSPVVTLTMNPAIDVSTSVAHVVSERKLRCQPPRYEPGGGGINVSRAVKRLGGDSLALYPAGGPAGRLLGELLEREGVTQMPLPIAGWTRENVNVFEEVTGRQFRFVLPGPTLSQEEWRRCLEALGSLRPRPEYVVASGSLPPGVTADFYAYVAALARDCGARMVLDSSGQALRLAAQEGVYLLKPSLREFEELTGGAHRDEAHLQALARESIGKGQCEVLVLSLGSSGVLWVTAAEAERVASPAVPVASTVGAGDSLVAGIVLALLRGRPLREAARFGVAAAAAAVMNPGTELCRREDAERLYERMLPAYA